MKFDLQAPYGQRLLALILGVLVMIGPFSIDTIFPAFSQIQHEFGVDALAVQQTLSVYLLAYALMSLLHGPLSDALGRKPVLLGGLTVFSLASVACANAPSLLWLLIFRVVQGLSAGVGMIIGRAIIRDLYSDATAQRLLSMVTMVFAIAPALAPVIGGWLLVWSTWRGIFYLLAFLSAGLFALVFFVLPETHEPQARQPLDPRILVRGYGKIMRDHHFLRLALVGSFNFGSIFLFVAAAPTVVREFLQLGERDFIWIFAPVILGMMLGSWISTRVAGRYTPNTQIRWSFVLMFGANLGNVIYTQNVHDIAIPWALLPLFFNSIGTTIAFPVLMLAMLDRHPERKGAASSMQAFINQSNNALVAGALAPALAQTPQRLALGALASAVIALLLWLWQQRTQAKLAT